MEKNRVQAQPPGLALQVLDGPWAGPSTAFILSPVEGLRTGSFFIVPFARVAVFGLVLEHSVDEARQLVRRGGDRCDRIVFAAHSAVKATWSALATTQAMGRHSEGCGRPVLRLFRDFSYVGNTSGVARLRGRDTPINMGDRPHRDKGEGEVAPLPYPLAIVI